MDAAADRRGRWLLAAIPVILVATVVGMWFGLATSGAPGEALDLPVDRVVELRSGPQAFWTTEEDPLPPPSAITVDDAPGGGVPLRPRCTQSTLTLTSTDGDIVYRCVAEFVAPSDGRYRIRVSGQRGWVKVGPPVSRGQRLRSDLLVGGSVPLGLALIITVLALVGRRSRRSGS